jgi:hypothetical protein
MLEGLVWPETANELVRVAEKHFAGFLLVASRLHGKEATHPRYKLIAVTINHHLI